MTARLQRAYRQTVYRAGGVEFKIGRRSSAVDALLRQYRVHTAVLITAHNPMSRRMPDRWNDRMQRGLLERLRRRRVLPGSGCWRGWSEDHFFVLGPIGPTVYLARMMRQNGIVILQIGQPALLRSTS